MTTLQLGSAARSTTANADRFLTYIADTCTRYNILSPVRQLCFLAQVGHESGGLYYTEELASGEAYEGRKDLGNIHRGDGVKFKGRGLIQITGYFNRPRHQNTPSEGFFMDILSDADGISVHRSSPSPSIS